MDVTKLLTELREQRDLLMQAITALERLALGGGKRRGRPPKWAATATDSASAPVARVRKKRVISADARKRMAEAQKKRWAAVRKAKAV